MKRISFLATAASRYVLLTFVTIALLLFSQQAGATPFVLDEPAKALDEAKADQPDEPVIDGLGEPDSKAPPALKDESDAIDPTNKETLAWYMAGQKAMKRGELQEAADAFQKAADADPKSAVPVRAQAMVLFRMGNVEQGLATAKKAMQLDPNDYQTRLELAVLFGTNNRFGDSMALLDEALASESLKEDSFDFVHVHQVRAAVLLEMRNVAGAAESYEIILKSLEQPEQFNLTDREHKTLLKSRLTGYEVCGRILLEAGRVPKAIQAFEALARTEKNAPGEHNLLLARAYFQQDKLPLCEENLNRYFETGRRSNESLLLLRDLFEATTRSDSLTTRLDELSKDASDVAAVKMFQGQILLDQGKTQEAAEVYQSVLDTSGEADAYLGLIRVEIANRDSEALIATINRAVRSRITIAELAPLITSIMTVDDFAKDILKSCLKTFEDKPGELHPGVSYFCSLIAEKMELADDESALLKATLELNPDRELQMQTLDRFAVNQLRKGEFPKAARTLEQLLSTPGMSPDARATTLFRISIAYGAIEDLDAARKALKEALKIIPDAPLLLNQLALVESTEGNLNVAEKLFLKSIDIQQRAENASKDAVDQLAETRIRLASIYAQLNQWDDSVDQYLLVLEIETLEKGSIRLAQMGLSNAYVQGGDMEKGQKVLEEVYEEDPTDVGVNNDLGYLYADQGKNLEQAEKMIRIAVDAQPENPAYLDSLGWVLFKQGKNEEALEPLKKANSDPDYQDSTLLEHQGDVHQALKQFDDAKTMWKKALDVEEKAKRADDSVLKRLKGKLESSTEPVEKAVEPPK